MKNKFTLTFLLQASLIVVTIRPCFPQQPTNKKSLFPIPQTTNISLTSSIYLNIDKTIKNGQWKTALQSIRLQSSSHLSKHFRLDIIAETDFNAKKTRSDVTQLKLNYSGLLKFKYDTTFFKNGIIINAELGKLQWFPQFTNTLVLLRNPQLFIDPQEFWGAGLWIIAPLLNDRSVLLNFRGHTGELFHTSRVQPSIQDLYLYFKKFAKGKLGIEGQIGKAEGSRHLVNYAYLTYMPKWENVIFTIKGGKLPAFDESPYGVHIGLSRKFKSITLGGFYERRLNQIYTGDITGFFWSVTGNSKIARLFQTFNFSFSTNSFFAFVPLARVSIQHR